MDCHQAVDSECSRNKVGIIDMNNPIMLSSLLCKINTDGMTLKDTNQKNKTKKYEHFLPILCGIGLIIGS